MSTKPGQLHTGAFQTTGGDGHAAVGSWTLGLGTGENLLAANSAGLASLVFAATGQLPSYDIDLRYVGTPPSSSQQSAFSQAASRWESVITSELANHLMVVPAGWCAGIPHAALNETIDDLLIFVEITTIDGAGGVLGQAGPCGFRPSDGQPVLGFMELDVADLNSLEASGDLGTVIRHEIGHVVGIGTNLWLSVLVGSGDGRPIFSQARLLWPPTTRPAAQQRTPCQLRTLGVAVAATCIGVSPTWTVN